MSGDDLVTVYGTNNLALHALAKSVLQTEGIFYHSPDEYAQDMFGWGRMSTGFNPIVGQLKLQVPERDAERARALLSQIEESDETQ